MGLWEIPLTDSSNYVYCFAAHETLSVVNGNSITVYVDGVATPSGWTFSESNNYESQGIISTIIFSADQENATITVKGKGKPTSSGGSTLMENAIEILVDYLKEELGTVYDKDIDQTNRATALTVFNTQSYSAAGVINKDVAPWATILRVMGSFNGDAYINGSGKLVLFINDGTGVAVTPSEVLGKGDVKFSKATLQRKNIINRLPVDYAYNFKTDKFNGRSDPDSLVDSASVNMFGERTASEPLQLYWARDLVTVQAIQAIIVDAQCDQAKVWEIVFVDNTLKRAHIDVGDYIAVSFDLLYGRDGLPLTNEIVKVIEVSPNFELSSIRFRVLDTGDYLTRAYIADGTYKADGSIKAGSTRDLTEY